MWRLLLPSFPQYPDNPLFKYEIRQVRWAGTPGHLRRYALISFLIVLVLVGLLWLFFATTFRGYSPDPFYDSLGSMTPLLLIVSIASNSWLDLGCVLLTANSFAGEITARRWDLLRLAALRSSIIVDGKYAVTQCRVWRLAIVVIHLRVATVLLFILGIVWNAIRYQSGWSPEVIGLLLVLLFVALVYMIEPQWRVQSYTARLLEGAYGKSSFLRALIAGLLWTVGLWVGQLISFGILGYVLGTFTLSTARPFIDAPFLILIVFFISCLVIAFALWWFYQFVGGRDALQNLTFRLNHDLADFD